VLPDGYTLVRNLRLPGSSGDVDAVLLTPAGDLWVLEIKTFVAPWQYRCRDLLWEYRRGPRDPWRPLDAQPSRQALFHARQVQGTLADAGLALRPRAAVVLAGPAPVALSRPRVSVLTPGQLCALLAPRQASATGTPLPALQEAIVGALLRAAHQ
jgi:hypothetical protein